MAEKKIGADALKASLQSMEPVGDDIEFVVRLANSATRALHYIADVRTTKYDPDTGDVV